MFLGFTGTSFSLDVNNTIISYSTHDKRLEVVFYTEWNRGMISERAALALLRVHGTHSCMLCWAS